jgi:hypothetical protein
MRIPRPSYFAWLEHRLRPAIFRRRLSAPALPRPGDVILRGSPAGPFELVEAITEQHIVGPVPLSRAVQLARAHGKVGVWHQVVDDRGRRLSPPAPLRLN